MAHDINSDYFEWLCNLVGDSKLSKRSYRKLLTFLYHTEFEYVMPLDGNRYADGIDLRYRFGRENSLDYPIIASRLDNNPCSILEMMVALAVRCEEHIMIDFDNGMMSGRWFWQMIADLGLKDMYDSKYDEYMVRDVVFAFINREYEYDGRGGLFHIPDTDVDLRTIEIWYQLHKYLRYRKNNGG